MHWLPSNDFVCVFRHRANTTDLSAITSTDVVTGGKGYTFGIVDLERTGTISSAANLIPIIPPSKGHGYDIYTELGADRVLIYARFDDSTKDFPVDTKFAQVGIVKNPKDRQFFTNKQCELINGLARKEGDQDDLNEVLSLSVEEDVFWNKMNRDPEKFLEPLGIF